VRKPPFRVSRRLLAPDKKKVRLMLTVALFSAIWTILPDTLAVRQAFSSLAPHF
jgi:hypothetical protein